MLEDFLQNTAAVQRKPTAQMPGFFLSTSKIYQSTLNTLAVSPNDSVASFLADIPLSQRLSC